VRETSCPVTTLPATSATLSGVSVSPELAADSPTAFTMKSGRKTMALRKQPPTKKEATLPVTKTRLPNSPKSRIGSTARRSATTKATSPRADSANIPVLSGEPQR